MKKCKGIIFLVLVLVSCRFLCATPSGQRLRVLADQIGMLIGYASINGFNSIYDAATYQEVARTEFNILTCENAMKMNALQPSRGSFNFGPADAHVQFAQANGMEVHGHTLVWFNQSPSWVRNISDRNQLINAMYTHIDTVLNHYQGQILVWDVVNEAFNEDGSFRSSFWYNVIGQDYIDLAFQRARQADPNAKLIINDYNLWKLASKSNSVYNMIQSMINRGIPIDGVGFQMHLNLTDYRINGQSFADNMARFADLGLEIYITELDIRIPANPSQNDLEDQADSYREVIQRALAQPAVKAIQVWGIPDKYSWVPSVFPGTGAPLLFDNNYNAKPCYYAVQEELENAGLLGDVNSDGAINIVDALQVAQFYIGLYPPNFDQSKADTNCDGRIDIVDALIIAQYYVRLIAGFCL